MKFSKEKKEDCKMCQTNNLISIIIPCKNGEKYLQEALDGIKKQKMNVEVILVDDGSTDGTSNIAKDNGCFVIRNEESQGPVKAKNQALKSANGDFILFHDCDDVLNDDSLKILYDEFEDGVEAVQAKGKDFISPDMPTEEKSKTIIKEEPYYGVFSGAILIRKSVFDKIGLFDESVQAGEIIDWQHKMNKHNLQIKKIDFVSMNRRIHCNNFGKKHRNIEYKNYASLLRMRIKDVNV